MMVMTAKVDKKKIAIALAAVAVVIVGLILLFGGGDGAAPTAATSVSTNDGRVKFLTDLGWQVNASPKESSQVRIPKEPDEVFQRYNALQKSQGYDLSAYAGKTVMRYVYQVQNYPGAAEPVYATLLVYKNKIIGGDVTDTAAKGVIQGLQMPKKPAATTPAATGPSAGNSTEPPVTTTPKTEPSA